MLMGLETNQMLRIEINLKSSTPYQNLGAGFCLLKVKSGRQTSFSCKVRNKKLISFCALHLKNVSCVQGKGNRIWGWDYIFASKIYIFALPFSVLYCCIIWNWIWPNESSPQNRKMMPDQLLKWNIPVKNNLPRTSDEWVSEWVAPEKIEACDGWE